MFRRRSRWCPLKHPWSWKQFGSLEVAEAEDCMHSPQCQNLVTEMNHAWLVVLRTGIRIRFLSKETNLCQCEIPHTEERKTSLGRCRCLEKVDKIGVAGGTVVAEAGQAHRRSLSRSPPKRKPFHLLSLSAINNNCVLIRKGSCVCSCTS